MRIFVPALIVVAVLYFWDKECHNGRLLDGFGSMWRSISTTYFLDETFPL
jgi:hypothetical protein